jgi:predicted glycoside hydrolase/deacetylase ChbG (UPF0249 family)
MRRNTPVMIVNADDFGRDQETNRAIVQAFLHGLCSSTTLMPNMRAFEEACELAHRFHMLEHIGIHFVLRDGFPLTEPIRRLPRFCDAEGRLANLGTKPIFVLDEEEKRALGAELRAQIKRCRRAGLSITHADSHYHIHRHWGILRVLIPLMREERIRYVRILRNCGRDIHPLKRWYKQVANLQLRRAGLARTRFFGSLADYLYLESRVGAARAQESFEMMLHPRLDSSGNLVNYPDPLPLERLLEPVAGCREAVSFTGSRYGSASLPRKAKASRPS